MVLAGFVRGQLSVCLILGAFYAVALMAIGLQFGFLVGMIAGLISFIPYVGSVVGLRALDRDRALPVLGASRSGSSSTAGIFFFGQFVEGNILAPNLIGKSVGLHPVWLILALSVFGALFGFAGLLVAVPVAAALGVLGRFLIEQYLASPLYTGRAAAAGGLSGVAAARQLVLDLPARPALGRADFFVSPSNALALAQVDRWPDWPGGRLAVAGPQGAGKTHLAHVWAARAGARDPAGRGAAGARPRRGRRRTRRWRSRTSTGWRRSGRGGRGGALPPLQPARAGGGSLMVSGRAAAGALAARAARSRAAGCAAAPVARLEPPDDALLAAVLVKLFADRQLAVRPT